MNLAGFWFGLSIFVALLINVVWVIIIKLKMRLSFIFFYPDKEKTTALAVDESLKSSRGRDVAPQGRGLTGTTGLPAGLHPYKFVMSLAAHAHLKKKFDRVFLKQA